MYATSLSARRSLALAIAHPSHLNRELRRVPVTTIEISGSQMVLVMKLTTFAWNVHDGRQSIEVGPDPLNR